MIAHAENIAVRPDSRIFVVRLYRDVAATPTTPGFDWAFLAVGNGDTATIKGLHADHLGPETISAVRDVLRAQGFRNVLWHRFDQQGEALPDFRMTLTPGETHHG